MVFHTVVVKLYMGAEMSPEDSTEGEKDPLPSALTLYWQAWLSTTGGFPTGLPRNIAAGFNLTESQRLSIVFYNLISEVYPITTAMVFVGSE